MTPPSHPAPPHPAAMQPVSFAGCFGWLHHGHGPYGVVLCAAFGREEALSHRGLLLLAARLAASGFHVLRYDYPGTGDSAGGEADPDRVATWRASVGDAIDALRALTDSERIILVGLRLGAALALQVAAHRPAVAGVACLAPVVSGRAHTRELRLLGNNWREAELLPPCPPDAGHLDVVGDRLHAGMLAELAELDLRTLLSAPPHALILDDGAPLAAVLAERLSTLGAAIATAPFPDARDYLGDAFSSRIPDAPFATVADWCRRILPLPAGNPTTSSRCAVPVPLLPLPGAIEHPLRFGPANGLFGILCEPVVPAPPGTPAVLMPNTGFNRHVGDGRVFVILARRLAALGIASLRMDMAGFGDSVIPGRPGTDPYAAGNADDLLEAVRLLGARGAGAPIVVGICSGAYAALWAALRAASHGPELGGDIAGIVLVNLQRFEWRPGTPLRIGGGRQKRPAAFYLGALLHRAAWIRLLRGEIAVGPILRALLRRPFQLGWRRFCLLLERLTGLPAAANRIRRRLRSLGARNIAVDLFYSAGDPGLSELALQLGPERSRLRGLHNVRVHVMNDADHALLDHSARQRFVDHLCAIVASTAAMGPIGTGKTIGCAAQEEERDGTVANPPRVVEFLCR